jgi:thiamine biosynthesis protein ThiS
MTLSPDPDHAGGGTDLSTTLSKTIDLTINGEPRAIPHGLTVATLLTHLKLDPRKVAVERNEAIVRRSAYTETLLTNADRIEIVHFIGGG